MRYASILLLVLTVSYLAKYIVYTQQNDQIIAAYKKEYLGTFPKAGAKFNYIGGDLSKVHDPVRNRLRREIMNSKKAIRNFTRLNRKSPALLALLRLSEDLPKSLKISILSFTYTQNNKMRFRVEAETYTALENFKNELAKLDRFSEVKQISTAAKTGSKMQLGEYLASFNPMESK